MDGVFLLILIGFYPVFVEYVNQKVNALFELIIREKCFIKHEEKQ